MIVLVDFDKKRNSGLCTLLCMELGPSKTEVCGQLHRVRTLDPRSGLETGKAGCFSRHFGNAADADALHDALVCGIAN